MSNRVFCFVTGLISLIIGCSLYVFFRSNTYISLLVSKIFSFKTILDGFDNSLYRFVSFYLPDFLWGLSLCFGLLGIYCPNRKMVFFLALIPFFYGLIWELLQYYKITKGTGDIYDVIMYLNACCIAVTIYEKRRMRNEKD